MFCGCSSLTDIDISGFDTRNVTLMYEMFGSCKQLTSLELGNFNTSTVIDMWGMFDNCTNLKTIFVGDKWNVESVRIRLDRQGPFFGCSNLVGGQGTTYNETLDFAKDFAYAHIDGGTDNSGYLTKSGEDPYVPGEPYAVFDSPSTTVRTSPTATTFFLLFPNSRILTHTKRKVAASQQLYLTNHSRTIILQAQLGGFGMILN